MFMQLVNNIYLLFIIIYLDLLKAGFWGFGAPSAAAAAAGWARTPLAHVRCHTRAAATVIKVVVLLQHTTADRFGGGGRAVRGALTRLRARKLQAEAD